MITNIENYTRGRKSWKIQLWKVVIGEIPFKKIVLHTNFFYGLWVLEMTMWL